MDLQECFRRMCLTRYFELAAARAYEEDLIPGPVYLAIGQEAPSAVISMLTGGYAVFPQHRCHSVYLSYGGDPAVLRDELLGLACGCCRGAGGSPSAQDPSISVYGYHGLIGENIPIATGFCLASSRLTVAYFGDAAAEEDYALASFGFAATHRLPILYVCEDNGLSILTPVRDRRTWNVHDVATAMGLATADIEDDPQLIYQTARSLLDRLPAFVNIRTCRHMWHAGAGMDGPPAYDRLRQFAKIVPQAEQIERSIEQEMVRLWQGLSLKP